MKRFLFVAPVVFVFLILSCTTSSDFGNDSWIADPYSIYPEKDYLCALGYGNDISEAETNAINGLVSGFALNVSSTIKTSVNEISNTAGTRTESSYANDIIMKAQAENLYGVQVLQRSIDAKSGKPVALAVLRKADAAAHYRQLAEKEKSQLVLLKMNVQNNIGRFSAVKDAARYRKTVEEYNLNASIYNYLSLQKMSLISKVEAERLESEVCSSIVASVSIENDMDGSLTAAIGRILTDKGFRISDSDPSVMVSGSIEWDETSADKFIFANYVFNLSVTEKTSGDTLFAYDARSREGHTSFASAKNRAIRKIVKDFASKLEEVI